jgi:peptidoglycan/LPS O-acetylase OafA/YrhL
MTEASRHFAPIDFRTRFPALDGIRALAVTLVFADHYRGGSHGGGLLQFINLARQRGWVGVDLFFVLSGFLITGILYDTRDDPHFWSLCVEEQFYLLWPIAVWLIRDRSKLLRAAIGISLLALVFRLAVLGSTSTVHAETWIFRTLPFRMDALLIGGILALLLRSPHSDRWQRAGKWVFLIGSAAVFAIFILSPAYDSAWLLSIGVSFTALASAGLICTTLRSGSPAFHVFYWKPLRILGKYSYGFYVYHLLFRTAWIHFLTFLGARWRLPASLLLLNFVVTFLVAKVSYDLIEVRFLRLKRGFEYDSEVVEHRHAFTNK